MIKLIMQYIYEKRRYLVMQAVFIAVFLAAFLLYHLPAAVILYPAVLCLILGIFFIIPDFIGFAGKHRRLTEMEELPGEMMTDFPEAKTISEGDYQRLIEQLRREQRETENQMNLRFRDMMDYYTAWVHQIKTPIAAMRLTLQNEDSELSRRLRGDLLRIEQYVGMVLCYLRLDGDSTDYVFKACDLDGIVRQVVRKFAGQFIAKKIALSYEPLSVTVVTDEKWLLFVLEQLLSNALKYTERGSISIYMEEPKTLCIRDTGIGIASEDLPRIFEKGYTGYNGRSDQRASGLGLYLCRRICKSLGHGISAESEPDVGTVMRLHLAQHRERAE